MLQIISNILRKSKWTVFGSVIIISSVPSRYIPIIIMTCLNCCNNFGWFYYDEIAERTFGVLLCWYKRCIICVILALVCMNYFQFLFVLKITEVCLVVCLELRFFILFLLLLLHHFLALVNHLIFLFITF